MERSTLHLTQWYDSQPLNIQKSLVRQFYHLYCDSSDGDLRAKVNAFLDLPVVTLEQAKQVIGNRVPAFLVMIDNRQEYKDFVNSIGV